MNDSATLTDVSLQRKILAWMPTVLWLAMIMWFSTDLFSSAHTGAVLLKIIRFVYGEISRKSFHLIHALVRKGAHVSVYGVLSGLAFYSWRTTLPANPRWKFLWVVLAMAMVLFASSLDEWHQRFVSSRTSSPTDVLLDMSGALFVQIMIASFTGSPRRHGDTE